ncbi:hypothetical protein LguiA_000280 [Lonicera macranthoides]
MGNCQAVDAAALVIQHPSGRIERMYWSISASEVMKMNPGHYVSLIIPLPNNINPTAAATGDRDHQRNPPGDDNNNKTVRLFTRVKLLRSTDTLVLGRAYRLITSQEVMKVLRAKRNAKMKKNQRESKQSSDQDRQSSSTCEADQARSSELDNISPPTGDERQQQRSGSTHLAAAARSKSWRPSLQSISESAS